MSVLSSIFGGRKQRDPYDVLVRSIKQGQTAKIQQILAANPELERRIEQPSGRSPIVYAARHGRLDLVQRFFPQSRKFQREAALHEAIKNRTEASGDIIRYLLDQKVDPNTKELCKYLYLSEGQTREDYRVIESPLEFIIGHYDYTNDEKLRLLSLLLSYQADPNWKSPSSSITPIERIFFDIDEIPARKRMIKTFMSHGGNPTILLEKILKGSYGHGIYLRKDPQYQMIPFLIQQSLLHHFPIKSKLFQHPDMRQRFKSLHLQKYLPQAGVQLAQRRQQNG